MRCDAGMYQSVRRHGAEGGRPVHEGLLAAARCVATCQFSSAESGGRHVDWQNEMDVSKHSGGPSCTIQAVRSEHCC